MFFLTSWLKVLIPTNRAASFSVVMIHLGDGMASKVLLMRSTSFALKL